MAYKHNEEWRMRVILSLAWLEAQPVVKETNSGEKIVLKVESLDREGLIEITSRFLNSLDFKTFRFDRDGELKAVFVSSAGGRTERVYDRERGAWKRHQFEVDSSMMIGRLEMVLREEGLGELEP